MAVFKRQKIDIAAYIIQLQKQTKIEREEREKAVQNKKKKKKAQEERNKKEEERQLAEKQK